MANNWNGLFLIEFFKFVLLLIKTKVYDWKINNWWPKDGVCNLLGSPPQKFDSEQTIAKEVSQTSF